MAAERAVSSLAIDLTKLLRRTVTSFYSNLVTRPTGRAIRMGVESQISELESGATLCLSVLDFSQVHVLDYSCADEIVAKLLLRFLEQDRPAEAYFVARGLREHHQEAVEAVLDRHSLLLVAQDEEGLPRLLGPADPPERACWAALLSLGRASAADVAAEAGLSETATGAALARLLGQRVAVSLPAASYCALSSLLRIEP